MAGRLPELKQECRSRDLEDLEALSALRTVSVQFSLPRPLDPNGRDDSTASGDMHSPRKIQV